MGLRWSGDYAVKSPVLNGSLAVLPATVTHAFDVPGTYFPALRVHTQRSGVVDTEYALIENLGRVRVVVT